MSSTLLRHVLLFACLLASALPADAESAASGRLRVVKGKVPDDLAYLEFLRWHESHSVLTLVVSGEDRDEARRALENLAALKKRNVLVREVVVVGTENADLFLATEDVLVMSKSEFESTRRRSRGTRNFTYSEYVSLLGSRHKSNALAKELGLFQPESVDTEDTVRELNLAFSPAWIVRHRGVDYIFEGKIDPKRLFAADGTFRAADLPQTRFSKASGVKFNRAAPESSKLAQRFRFVLPPGAGEFDGKPDCSESNVRRTPVLVDSPELKLFDLLVYEYRDPAQVAGAERWEFPSVPYLEGDLANPHRKNKPQQYWSRFFDIRCLPTRVHYRTIEGVKYEEYREGERAFDREY